MRKKIDRNAVLDLWAKGLTSDQIAERMGIQRGSATNIILRARDLGDKRAVSRSPGRRKQEAISAEPAL